MRILLSAFVVASVAACSPPVPDSAAGVGFENYDTYLAQKRARDQQLRNGPTAASPAAQPTAPQTEAQATAAAAVEAIRPTGTASPAAAPAANNAEISDEQDFGAVSARQSIESDAQRRANQSAQYTVVQPTAVPSRPGGTTPTPIEFALQVTHPVGQKTYTRSPFGAAKAQANCAAYVSAELAQDAFLKAGGPSKDKLKLDPDGDGYACGWNPAKYRQLVRN
ncbi:hypothetical protein [uncultured Litoreibacter sp.]|uniref:hypothetical protein n=1 Tax=uncultured Litoreibacter sp. TaxID=1392394 RepID=UPI002609919C|nr:hypothetical protein [uncultured Litoreibacter sp.]